MSSELSVRPAFTLLTYEDLAQRTRTALNNHFPGSAKELARSLGVSPSLVEKWKCADRAPSGVQLVNLDAILGPSFMEEIRQCPDKNREEVLRLVGELEERLRTWK